MRVLFVTAMNNQEVREIDFIPRIGEMVNIFYTPWPKVDNVVYFPDIEGVDVIVSVN